MTLEDLRIATEKMSGSVVLLNGLLEDLQDVHAVILETEDGQLVTGLWFEFGEEE